MRRALPTPQSRDSGSTINSSGHVSLHNPVLHIMLIIILGLLAYSNTFHVPFQYDDTLYITGNPAVKDLRYYFKEPSNVKKTEFYITGNPAVKDLRYYFKGPSNVEKVGFPTFLLKTRFIAFLTFALNYELHGSNVTGYHISNLAIHVLNALLVYYLVVLTFRTLFFKVSVSIMNQINPTFQLFNYLPLFVALLFVSHPIQTQAVTYIWQRVTSLATFFYLLSLVMYIKSGMHASVPKLHAKRYSLYAASFISAILAMLTKEIAFTLPIVIALYEFMFFEGKIKKRVFYLIPLILTMLIIPLARLDGIGNIGAATKEMTGMSRWDYLFTQFRVIVTYIRLLFLPVNQNLDYDYPVFHSFFNPNVFLSFLFLLSIFCLGVYLFYRSRFAVPGSQSHNSQLLTFNLKLISFGIFWFFITLLVESSVIPIADVIFDHRLYLPSIGVFISLTISMFILLEKSQIMRKGIKRGVIATSAMIIVVLTVATYARNTVWKDEINLWGDVLRKSPKSARANYSLGLSYQSKGFTDEAIKHYQSAIQFKPDDPDSYKSYNNLGNAYLSKGLIDLAIKHYMKAICANTDFALAYINLGIVYQAIGQTDRAIELYRHVITLQADNPSAHYYLGNAYLSKGIIQRAIEHFQIAVMLEPDNAKAHLKLAIAYKENGWVDKAMEHFNTARQLNPALYKEDFRTNP